MPDPQARATPGMSERQKESSLPHMAISDPERVKETIRSRGRALGFDEIGFSSATLPHEERRLATWLAAGYHGQMHWMARNVDRRTDATKSHPGTQTVICCRLSYYLGPPEPLAPTRGILSSYARGEDYHRVLGYKVGLLARDAEQLCGVTTKVYVDTGPLLEKGFAVSAGLGWVGKHANLLSRRGSSWFFLGEILLPLPLPPDRPEHNYCGTCTRCIAACPTGAIVQPYVVDSRLCISYLTIELRGAIPRNLRPLVGRRIYGCDDCQDVCPWNRFAKRTEETAFLPREPLASMDLIEMLQLTRDEFLAATRSSAVRRARYDGFLRNVAVALGNSRDPRAVAPLAQTLEHPEPLVRGHAAWALGELGSADVRDPLIARRSREDVEEVKEEINFSLARVAGDVRG
jgi:epoxyqueuosine reductase